ncbi:MAG: DUF222 domain-containing protein, partial [Gammaproteobacteria bacterium]
KTCAQWLNWRCGISTHTAREKIRVAHALVGLEKISASFERGELSYSKVRAVTRVADKHNEEFLLNIAVSGTAAQLERVVRCEIRTERDEDISARTEAAFDNREFSWRETEDGSVEFFGRLPAELADKVISAIKANEKNAAEETSSPKARRADALVSLADSGCEGYEVSLRVPAGTSQTASSLDSGATIPMAAAERLCCDASIIPVVEGEQGEVLDIGRRTRTIPPAISRALKIRDKGSCRFPGCTHTQHLQGHHIQHWAHGGKTSLDNLVSLCWHHHHLMHEGGFGCSVVKRRGRTGVHIVFRRPDGVIIPDAFRLEAVTSRVEEQQAGFGIRKTTCMAKDSGSRLDVDLILYGLDLLKRERD